MRKKWRSFELPNRVMFEDETLTDGYGKFVAEPFERGFGVTVGNGLRRVLLSSIEGAAVTKVKIEGVQHEFDSIDGVVEDIPNLVLNLKHLLIQIHSDEEVEMTLKVSKDGEVTAADITEDSKFEIVNPDPHICTLAKKVDLHITMWARKGRGYVTAEENMQGEQEIGIIPVDSIFSPIRRVKYSTENTRVGKMTNYDRLIMEIWTDGTVEPKMALVEASKILRMHLNSFVQFPTLGEPTKVNVDTLPSVEDEEEDEDLEGETAEVEDDMDSELLNQEISELELPNRALNCLKNASVKTVGKLLQITEEELKSLPKLGKTSVKQIKEALDNHGLSLRED